MRRRPEKKMSGSGPMDAFVVDHNTAVAVNDAKGHIKELLEEKVERTTFTVEEVKIITDYARKEARCTKSAAAWWNYKR